MLDFIYLSIAISYGFLIGFVIHQGLVSAAHRYFLFFLVSLLLWHLTLYIYLFIPVGDWLLLLGRFNYAMGPFFTFGLLGFFYTFPYHTFRFSKATERAFWAWALFLAGISLLTPLIDKNEVYVENIGPVLELGDWYLIYLAHMFAMPLLTLLLGIKKYFSLKGLARIKFGFSFWIFIPTMLAFVITNGILPMYGIIWQFVYSPIFLVPIAISSALAMYRYRFFDLSYQTLKVLRTGMLLLGFSIIGLGCYEALNMKILPGYHVLNFVLSSLISLVFLVKIETWLPEFISSGFREFRYKMNELKSSLYYCNSYPELFKKLESAFVIDLHFTSVHLYLIREKKNNIEIPIYFKDRYTETIEKNQIKILVSEEVKLEKDSFYLEFLEKLNACLCYPIYLEKKLIGFFVLGKKSQQDYLSREEIDEILKAKQFIELCFINILLQSDLKEENDYMKQLIQQKTKNLRQQNEKIKSLLQQQSDFIAVTAHEFRTPLNIALLQLEDTLESYEHSSQVLDDMKVLEASLDKLKHLTKNLFDVQQYDLRKVKMNLSEVNLLDFITDIFQEFQDMTAREHIQLSLENHLKKNSMVEIDETKMRQVFHNLLSNAQKFIDRRGKIVIHLEEKTDRYNVQIIDNGPGVPDHAKKKIFEKFQTINAHMGMGIGLGLYLCKRIIELHKGTIVVSDTSGGGATFTVGIAKPTLKMQSRTGKKNLVATRK